MEEAIKKELLYNLDQAIEILEKREGKDVDELKELSNHAIEDVAVYKNLDLISATVLIYSLYKIAKTIPEKNYEEILTELKNAKQNLEANNFGRYNASIKNLFRIIKECNAKVKIHLHDVMHAARIKKSAILLEKGLSIGQAAGLMGLSNWDLQEYAGKTTYAEPQTVAIPAKKRIMMAFKIFGFKDY